MSNILTDSNSNKIKKGPPKIFYSFSKASRFTNSKVKQ